MTVPEHGQPSKGPFKCFACKIVYQQVSDLTYFISYHYLELPWDEPTKTNKEYLDWLNNKVNKTPWIKMDSQSLGMMYGSVVFFFSENCSEAE